MGGFLVGNYTVLVTRQPFLPFFPLAHCVCTQLPKSIPRAISIEQPQVSARETPAAAMGHTVVHVTRAGTSDL